MPGLGEKYYNNMTPSDAIYEVEDFIKKMRNRDIIIDGEKARSIIVYYHKGKKDDDKEDKRMTLAEALSASITDYELGIDLFPLSHQQGLANLCLPYINKAYTNGIILENKPRLQET